MATEQQLLDALEQSIANTDRGNSDLLLVMKEGNLSDVTLRDNTVVPSLSKRVKENTDVFKGEFEASVNLQTQEQLDLFNTNATAALNLFDTDTTAALGSFDGTSTQALTNLQTAIDSINNEGNAASATKLQTPRLINNVPFDGTQNIDIPSATTSTTGVVKLVNDLITGGTDKALTAEQGKALLAQFITSRGESGRINIPNPDDLSKPTIIQWATKRIIVPANSGGHPFIGNWFVAFPNSCNFFVGVKRNQLNTLATVEDASQTTFSGFCQSASVDLEVIFSVIGIGS